ncbi:MAG TPA: class II SORL domain-containing protein [Anaerolineae bacterium]|nr:class II SORL domain-containing protein [Anaerolineae bacterium]HOQ99218.1 class II SORL domain-containing protein [Anaerolineae bacterium]
MATLGEHVQHADWKLEKHAPAIACPERVKAGELFTVGLTLGSENAHPNTTEHHIRWIALYFQPQGAKFIYEVDRFEFNAHGEATAGANQGPVYSHYATSATLKITQPGTLHALAFCNIHGLWESTKEIELF